MLRISNRKCIFAEEKRATLDAAVAADDARVRASEPDIQVRLTQALLMRTC